LLQYQLATVHVSQEQTDVTLEVVTTNVHTGHYTVPVRSIMVPATTENQHDRTHDMGSIHGEVHDTSTPGHKHVATHMYMYTDTEL